MVLEIGVSVVYSFYRTLYTSNAKGLVKMCQDQVVQGNPNYEKYVRQDFEKLFNIHCSFYIEKCTFANEMWSYFGSAEHSLQVAFT